MPSEFAEPGADAERVIARLRPHARALFWPSLLLIAGIGGWLGYLLFSRLLLLVDRIGFLLGDWLGLAR